MSKQIQVLNGDGKTMYETVLDHYVKKDAVHLSDSQKKEILKHLHKNYSKWNDEYIPSLKEEDLEFQAKQFLQALGECDATIPNYGQNREELQAKKAFCMYAVAQTKKFNNWDELKTIVLENLIRRTVATLIEDKGKKTDYILSKNCKSYNSINSNYISEDTFRGLCVDFQFRELLSGYKEDCVDESSDVMLSDYYAQYKRGYLDVGQFPSLARSVLRYDRENEGILPRKIKDQCESAMELRNAKSLYNSLSPFIKNDMLNTCRINYPMRDSEQCGMLSHKKQEFQIHYGGIQSEQSLMKFIKKEINHGRLSPKDVESFKKINKIVCECVAQEWKKVYPQSVLRVDTRSTRVDTQESQSPLPRVLETPDNRDLKNDRLLRRQEAAHQRNGEQYFNVANIMHNGDRLSNFDDSFSSNGSVHSDDSMQKIQRNLLPQSAVPSKMSARLCVNW